MTEEQRQEPPAGPVPSEPLVPRRRSTSAPEGASPPPPDRYRGDSPTWKQLAIGTVVFVLVLFGVPMMIEEVEGPCPALEVRAFTLSLGGYRSPQAQTPMVRSLSRSFLREFATGGLAALVMEDRFPFLPPDVSCAGMYWASLFSPQVLDMRNLNLRDMAPPRL